MSESRLCPDCGCELTEIIECAGLFLCPQCNLYVFIPEPLKNKEDFERLKQADFLRYAGDFSGAYNVYLELLNKCNGNCPNAVIGLLFSYYLIRGNKYTGDAISAPQIVRQWQKSNVIESLIKLKNPLFLNALDESFGFPMNEIKRAWKLEKKWEENTRVLGKVDEHIRKKHWHDAATELNKCFADIQSYDICLRRMCIQFKLPVTSLWKVKDNLTSTQNFVTAMNLATPEQKEELNALVQRQNEYKRKIKRKKTFLSLSFVAACLVIGFVTIAFFASGELKKSSQQYRKSENKFNDEIAKIQPYEHILGQNMSSELSQIRTEVQDFTSKYKKIEKAPLWIVFSSDFSTLKKEHSVLTGKLEKYVSKTKIMRGKFLNEKKNNAVAFFDAQEWKNCLEECEAYLKVEFNNEIKSLQIKAEKKFNVAELFKRLTFQKNEKKWSDCILLCDEILELEPNYPQVSEIKEYAEKQQSVEENLKKADEALSEELYDACVRYCDEVIKLDNSNIDASTKRANALNAMCAIARQYEQSEKWGECITQCENILQLEPSMESINKLKENAERKRSIADFVQKAKDAKETKDFGKCAEYCDNALKIDSENPDAKRIKREVLTELQADAEEAKSKRDWDALAKVNSVIYDFDRDKASSYAQDIFLGRKQDALREKLESAQQEANEAETASDWKNVLAKADYVLTEDSDNIDALKLKEQAEEQLKPKYMIRAYVDGQEITPTIVPLKTALPDGDWPKKLVPDSEYAFNISYTAPNGMEYYGKINDFTCWWEGLNEQRIDLKKISWTVKLSDECEFCMVYVEPGSFTMSRDDGENKSDETEHRVTLTQIFGIGKTEVTQKQWMAIMGEKENPSHFVYNDECPVEMVSWDDIQEFLKKLNEKLAGKIPAGYKFDLPTEAQWEYAALGGPNQENYTYAGNNSLGKVGWYKENCNGLPQPVGKKAPNKLGLYDMSGNVWEWCRDSCDVVNTEIQTDTYVDDIKDPFCKEGTRRILRGGGWYDAAKSCRVTHRNKSVPSYQNYNYGFRLALVPIEEDE